MNIEPQKRKELMAKLRTNFTLKLDSRPSRACQPDSAKALEIRDHYRKSSVEVKARYGLWSQHALEGLILDAAFPKSVPNVLDFEAIYLPGIAVGAVAAGTYSSVLLMENHEALSVGKIETGEPDQGLETDARYSLQERLNGELERGLTITPSRCGVVAFKARKEYDVHVMQARHITQQSPPPYRFGLGGRSQLDNLVTLSQYREVFRVIAMQAFTIAFFGSMSMLSRLSDA